MKLWLCVLAVSAANWLMKAAGPLVLGKRALPPALVRITQLTAPALLAGLIVTDLGGRTIDWTQLVGVAVAGVLNLLRVPILPAAAAGVAATALVRLASA
ncbi:AzlD domain-containing protein [Kribbella kalugense]|uniref:Branched-subunit amino acid transport protein AzlD n=1 Tax=Kribbella kalugense TaxID=2512221 RepID=A0A4R7ZT73_9ACTN|nr:AzlD domain-containing protein [Kribbella kalugense]TDW21223.1 branched-subunit amino acid transport protein AzlD [Kribbella kalugense]